MILNILNISFESLLFLVAGEGLLYSFYLLCLEYHLSESFLKYLLGLTIINYALHFLIGTNPEQNRVVLLLSITVFYVFLFFILKILKKGADKIK